MLLSTSLECFLRTMEYPATRDDLTREAKRDGLDAADQNMLATLADQSYSACWDVTNALGARIRHERSLIAA
ncbi:hypothetical protein FM104_15125 [Microbacterium esteraromaticum]|uniref:DUF2795 domain-containing protein n=1 Tax=Microbacterium esteraromaticum TaxID=57043 RepID=A0A1R4KQW2_9MICO|nr:DUF2795 domain-containing protein [Microbacterium esteraromaticum]SJN46639.1 hypothetical protein FM104_15125 [Microbacterium esteraromaticum]